MRVAGKLMAIALVFAAACSPHDPLDGMQPGEQGRVVRVVDGDALVLDTGQSVRLVGVEAPAMNYRSGEPDPHAEKSARILEDLVMGREVELFYPGLTRDRYDRALAHIRTADGAGPSYWINLELARRGAARVRLYPDTDGAGEALFAAEDEARIRLDGLWSDPAYQPVAAADLPENARGFMIITGTLGAPARRPDEDFRRTLCSRAMQASQLVVDIAFTARPLCDTPEGTPVELRGWVGGGRLELTHPLHLREIAGD